MQLLLNIDVPDLAEGERFYAEAFGLHRGRRFGEDALELLGAQAPVYLLRKAAGSIGAGATSRDYLRHWTPLHIDVAVPVQISRARRLARPVYVAGVSAARRSRASAGRSSEAMNVRIESAVMPWPRVSAFSCS